MLSVQSKYGQAQSGVMRHWHGQGSVTCDQHSRWPTDCPLRPQWVLLGSSCTLASWGLG